MHYPCRHVYLYFFHHKMANDCLAIKVIKMPLHFKANYIC